MHMMFALPTERYEVQPELARALEIILILHMDHEQNASTSTVRTAGMCCAPCFLLSCSTLLHCSLLHRRCVLHQLLCRGVQGASAALGGCPAAGSWPAIAAGLLVQDGCLHGHGSSYSLLKSLSLGPGRPVPRSSAPGAETGHLR